MKKKEPPQKICGGSSIQEGQALKKSRTYFLAADKPKKPSQTPPLQRPT